MSVRSQVEQIVGQWASHQGGKPTTGIVLVAALISEHDAGKVERLRGLVWQWVINYNNHSYDVDNLISELEAAGFPCPEDLKDE